MKKVIGVLCVIAAIGLSTKAFAADGTILLTNYGTPSQGTSDQPIFENTVGNLAPVGTLVQVLGGPSAGAMVVLANLAGQTQFAIADPGFIDNGYASVPGVAEGGVGSFLVRAWNPTSGASYDVAGRRGSFGPFTQVTGGNVVVGPPPGPPTPKALGDLRSFVIVVPEPSTFVLGLLGAGALLLIRRRK